MGGRRKGITTNWGCEVFIRGRKGQGQDLCSVYSEDRMRWKGMKPEVEGSKLAVRQDFLKSMGGRHGNETPSEISPLPLGGKENPCLFRRGREDGLTD